MNALPQPHPDRVERADRIDRIRLLPVPVTDPAPTAAGEPATAPHPMGGRHGQGTLALAFVLPSGAPAVPAPPPSLRVVADDDFGPRPTPGADLPDPHAWAARLVQALVEVLAGDRPLGQLVRWTTLEVYEQLRRRATLAASARSTQDAQRRAVASVHVSLPADGVAEVSAVLRGPRRCSALALRLEGRDGRWQCTALRLG